MEKETADTHMPLLAVLCAELVFVSSCPHISKEQGKTETILNGRMYPRFGNRATIM